MSLDKVFDIRYIYPAFATVIISILLILTKEWHGKHSCDTTVGIQKFHTHQVPRVGGVAIYFGFIAAWFVASGSISSLIGSLLIASLPAFVAGLTEDLTKRVGVRTRLIATLISGVLAWRLTGYSINHIDIPGIDDLFTYKPLAIAFTAFAIAGIANATNIIDGFNGLAAGTMVVCYTAICFIALQVGDIEIVQLCLFLIVVTSGFLVVNFPFGKIFMGDGGAYLLGFMLAWVSVMLPMRNPSVSVWAPFLVCSYPIIETIFSMGRRYINQENPGHPDIAHMHSLIKLRIVNRYFPNLSQSIRNGMVSPFCWAYALIPSSLSVLFYKQQALLIVSCVVSFIIYTVIYRFLINREQKIDHPAQQTDKDYICHVITKTNLDP